MAAFYSQHILPEALTTQYSVLHQGRLYLVNALAQEESQGESLTHTLMALQAQLHHNETSDPPVNTRKLRQQVKTVRQKLGSCQNRERALAANLASVTARMEGVKRYNWQNAQARYAIQLQQAQQHAQNVLMMSPSRPAFALRSPANVDLAAEMQYLTLAPSSGPVFGNRASLDPYIGSFNQPFAPIDLAYPAYGEPFPAQIQMPLTYPSLSQELSAWSGYEDTLVNTTSDSSPVSAVSMTLPSISPLIQDWGLAKHSELGRQRASSMLETVHECPPIVNTAVRRLSLLDGSAALKLEREAADERSKVMFFDQSG
ncbi:uncharacterized protein AB675_4149 [Cyphellophora attinorum]|uniref:Uncharacterized protein n=1 Tax=Cyphellophora attinorum TaxID=1664694 RepID=A0A0N1HRS8_9EURO|nr:uncharacterized protein AB675_4149 [Phialophora attinorum]KPI38616.1 hypothetical protein AB675_4149 [Phialophora attinorum]